MLLRGTVHLNHRVSRSSKIFIFLEDTCTARAGFVFIRPSMMPWSNTAYSMERWADFPMLQLVCEKPAEYRG